MAILSPFITACPSNQNLDKALEYIVAHAMWLATGWEIATVTQNIQGAA